MFPQTFATSDELFAYLRSAAGGSLLVRDTETSPYAVIYYNKKTSNMALPHVAASRSVVWDKVANQAVFVAPAHGRKFGQAVDDKISNFVAEEFGSPEGGALPKQTPWVCEEFVDGVMINMFNAGGVWTLATRTQIGATNNFYGTRPFAELFWETFASVGLTQEDLNPAATYSWVLQHPEERIVVAAPYGIARLALVQVTGPLSEKLEAFLPEKYALATLEDVKEFVTAEGRRRGVQWQGVCLKVGGVSSSVRYKLRSNEYDEARFLRGNQAKRPYTWLELWSKGKLPAYLRIYPEEQCDADAVITNFKGCTQELHDLYMTVYRRKELPLGQAPQKYRKLLWDAHKANKGAYFPACRQFMNEQDTARKLWLVNYEVRYAAEEAPVAAEPIMHADLEAQLLAAAECDI